ncbi:sigma 54-interacting transcriptional regulator [Vibrio alfacsensis]|uniref:sigma 54-interacting transcriptional regulator n=1 Tax=Vibrio alfacsensis TaxID=1074311 RepID=UPI004067709E
MITSYHVSEPRLEGTKSPEMIKDFIRLMSKVGQLELNEKGVFILFSHEFVSLSLRGSKALKQELETLGLSVGSYWQPDSIGLAEIVNFRLRNKQRVSIFALPIMSHEGRALGYIAYLNETEVEHLNQEYVLTVLAEYLAQTSGLRQQSIDEKINHLFVEEQQATFLALDNEGFIVHASEPFCHQFNIRATELINASIYEYFIFPPKVKAQIAHGMPFNVDSVDFDFVGELKQLCVSYSLLDSSFKLLKFSRPIEKATDNALRLLPTLERFETESVVMNRVLNSAKEAVKGRSPIYIMGEEGTGKRSLALAIHNSCDHFKEGPFIAVNLHSAKREDLSALLLGGENGSGTKSKFELANGGTLYIERIDLLPGVLQAALTHIILTKTLFDINTSTSVNLNFRLITSSIRPLEDLVHERRFCPSLYFYLTGATLQIPNLQSRSGDIPMLVKRKLLELAGNESAIEGSFLQAMLEYAEKRVWSGNIAELFKWIEHTYLNRENLIIDANLVESAALGAPIQPLEEIEKREIANALSMLDRKYNIVADQLGISLSTLRRKIAKYEL